MNSARTTHIIKTENVWKNSIKNATNRTISSNCAQAPHDMLNKYFDISLYLHINNKIRQHTIHTCIYHTHLHTHTHRQRQVRYNFKHVFVTYKRNRGRVRGGDTKNTRQIEKKKKKKRKKKYNNKLRICGKTITKTNTKKFISCT